MDSNKGEAMTWKKRGVALALTLALTVSTSVVMGAPAQQQMIQQQGPSTVDSRTSRATLILAGNCVKIGVKDTGSLGVGGNTNPGIQYDDTCTGTFNDAYDFLTPGTPWENIAVNVDGTSYVENNDGPHDIATNPTIQDKSGIRYRGTTFDKRAVQMSENAKFKMENDIRFNNNSKFIEITTYITATVPMTEVYTARGIDSDAKVLPGDRSATNNSMGYSTISGKYLIFSETTVSEYVMGYYIAKESNTQTGMTSWNTDAKQFYQGIDLGDGDVQIGVAMKFTSVSAGGVMVFPHTYIFGRSAYRAAKMAVDLGLGGGTPGKTPGCTGTALKCAPKNVGSSAETNTPAPTNTPVPTAASTSTPTVYSSPTNTNTPTNTPTFTPTLTPSPIPFLMKKGAVGASFVLGLLQNKTLVTWGMNREFQTNIPPCCGSGIDDIAVGTNFALALKGGKVYGWGANTKKQITFPATVNKDIVSIAAGGSHGLALSKTGLVYAWGDTGYKQTTIPKGLKDVVSIAAGTAHSLVVKRDGTVAAWGANESGQTKVPAAIASKPKKKVVQVAGGLDHSVALLDDATVLAWGGNAKGQSTVPANAKDMKQVSAGTQFTLAVRKDGTVFGWGSNEFNQLFIPAEYTDIFNANAGYSNTILGLRNGRIIVLGDQSNGVNASRTPTKSATPTP
jgi:alpha-tubulin suppressor-like RCC1 family protein